MTKKATAKKKLSVAVGAGIATVVILLLLNAAKFAPLVAWDITALTYVVWDWLTIRGMTPSETKKHATTEDPGRALAGIILIFASIASLIAVAFMITLASSSEGLEKAVEVALGLFSVIVSWAV